MLGRHIGRLERRRLVRMHRAHVDHDAAAIVLVHVLERRLGGEERAVDVDRLHLLPVGKRVVFDRIDDLNAGVGNEDIDRAEFRRHSVDALIDGLFARDVHRHADCLAAALRDFFSDGVRAVLIQVGDRDSRARRGERVSAICLPMPLAAPVTTATLPSRFVFSAMRTSFLVGNDR